MPACVQEAALVAPSLVLDLAATYATPLSPAIDVVKLQWPSLGSLFDMLVRCGPAVPMRLCLLLLCVGACCWPSWWLATPWLLPVVADVSTVATLVLGGVPS